MNWHAPLTTWFHLDTTKLHMATADMVTECELQYCNHNQFTVITTNLQWSLQITFTYKLRMNGKSSSSLLQYIRILDRWSLIRWNCPNIRWPTKACLIARASVMACIHTINFFVNYPYPVWRKPNWLLEKFCLRVMIWKMVAAAIPPYQTPFRPC